MLKHNLYEEKEIEERLDKDMEKIYNLTAEEKNNILKETKKDTMDHDALDAEIDYIFARKTRKPKWEEQETFEEAVKDMISAYIEESIEHFLRRFGEYKEDGRYFYNDAELTTFKDDFVAAGGDLETLHIGPVYNNDYHHTFLCWEVCHKNYYDNPKVNNPDNPIYFS